MGTERGCENGQCDQCTVVTQISCGGRLEGNTGDPGAASFLPELACGGVVESGRALVVAFRAESETGDPQEVEVALHPSGANLDLFVLEGPSALPSPDDGPEPDGGLSGVACEPGECIAWSAVSSDTEELTFQADPFVYYFLVVHSPDEIEADFAVTTACVSPNR